MAGSPSSLISTWLARQLPEAGKQWLDERLGSFAGGVAEREIHITFGMIPRRLGRDDLNLTPEDLIAAGEARADWDPSGWSIDEAARILVLCTLAEQVEDFAALFTELCRTADVQESLALYKGLPLYPAPETLLRQSAEGVRTNMRAIFEAVAHRNPYPRDYFDEAPWNQMVLKALFIGSSLGPIVGLDARANPALAAMLCDYAHERWAADRPVSPELWRCVGPFAEGAALKDLERALRSSEEKERRGAALALSANPSAEAQALLASVPDLARMIEDGALSWRSFMTDL